MPKEMRNSNRIVELFVKDKVLILTQSGRALECFGQCTVNAPRNNAFKERLDKLRHIRVAVRLSSNVVGHTNKVTLCRAGLALGCVTIRWHTVKVFSQATRPTQLGHLSVGRQNEY